MNTHLEILFKKYKITEKDKYEINQFFSLLPDYKKQNILNNFEVIAIKLYEINKNINIEREILIGNEVNNIKNLIISGRINKEREEFKKEILK